MLSLIENALFGGVVTRKVILCILVGLSPFISAHAQAESEEAKFAGLLKIELKKMYGTDAQLDAAVRTAYGATLSPEKTLIGRKYFQTLFFHEKTPDFLARLVLPLANANVSKGQLNAAMMEGLLGLQLKGLARLSTTEHASFIVYMGRMSQGIPASQCKAMYLNQMSTAEAIAVERSYIVSASNGEFEQLHELYRAAVLAELNSYPDKRTINAQQAEVAAKVYESASQARIRLELTPVQLTRIQAGVATAPPSDVCAFMTAYVTGMLDMPEPYKGWQLRFVESMQ